MELVKRNFSEHSFFTSDTHFGHKNVIQYCNRPFSTIEEMDETLIENWNKVVMPTDTVIHLGDFALGGKDAIPNYLGRLNGHILLMKGNHDRTKSFWRQYEDKIGMLEYGYQMGLALQDYGDWHGIIFSHRPMELNKIPEGYLNFHGHIHSTPTNRKYNTLPHIDVGTDYWGFTPVTMRTILDTMVGRK